MLVAGTFAKNPASRGLMHKNVLYYAEEVLERHVTVLFPHVQRWVRNGGFGESRLQKQPHFARQSDKNVYNVWRRKSIRDTNS